MTKLKNVAISHNFNFRGWWCFFVPVQEQFAENNKITLVDIIDFIYYFIVFYNIFHQFVYFLEVSFGLNILAFE